MAKYVYFDTETTGFKPGQIGQISAIISEDNNISTINYFFEVEYVNPDVTATLGRDVAYYKNKSNGLKFADKANEIRDIFNNAIFVAHNLKFDENFLSVELWRCGLTAKKENQLDTMEHYKPIIGAVNSYGRLKNPKLVEVVKGLGLNEEKIRDYAKMLFKDSENEIDYHDSRYDTTVVFVITNIARELQDPNSEKTWLNHFK